MQFSSSQSAQNSKPSPLTQLPSQPRLALALSLFGLIWLALFFINKDSGPWAELNRQVFFFFNSRLQAGSWSTELLALANLRQFDIIAFCAMGFIYLYYFLKEKGPGRRRMIALGLCMLLAAVFIKQCGRLIPYRNPSPSLVFPDAIRLSSLTSLSPKDASASSFPGDHGMMLFIFAAFMARYFGLKAGILPLLVAILFSLPRIAAGAHWLSDIYAGSLSILCIFLSWFLLSPASDFVAKKLEKLIPPQLFN